MRNIDEIINKQTSMTDIWGKKISTDLDNVDQREKKSWCHHQVERKEIFIVHIGFLLK